MRLSKVAAVTTLLAAAWYSYACIADGARLEPDQREVLVREVDNGYLILYRTRNNPYPIQESVAYDATVAAAWVADYLKRPLPRTRWGK
jgi:hypothetical protein